jgi:hypothetical protein
MQITDENGSFEGYADDETQAAWVGFAIGARAYERFAIKGADAE